MLNRVMTLEDYGVRPPRDRPRLGRTKRRGADCRAPSLIPSSRARELPRDYAFRRRLNTPAPPMPTRPVARSDIVTGSGVVVVPRTAKMRSLKSLSIL